MLGEVGIEDILNNNRIASDAKQKQFLKTENDFNF